MLKNAFMGWRISHYHPNPVVKAFIISEGFFWSAWYFITPILAIFVIGDINKGTIEIAATAFSARLITQIIFELAAGKYLQKSTEIFKFITTIFGMVIISISYVGFSYTYTLIPLYFFYILNGMGFGISSPTKYALFSVHLDKNKETAEWSIRDAVTLIGMALATSLGGFMASRYGFRILFMIAAVINLIGTLPYLLYINHEEKKGIWSAIKKSIKKH